VPCTYARASLAATLYLPVCLTLAMWGRLRSDLEDIGAIVYEARPDHPVEQRFEPHHAACWRLTHLGALLARLPVDLQPALLCAYGYLFGVFDEVCGLGGRYPGRLEAWRACAFHHADVMRMCALLGRP